MAFGPHFQEAVERNLEVFQANVANGKGKMVKLIDPTSNHAPKSICTHQARSRQLGANFVIFDQIFQARACVQALAKTPQAPQAHPIIPYLSSAPTLTSIRPPNPEILHFEDLVAVAFPPTFFFIGLSGELDLPDKRPTKILNPQMKVYAAPQARQKNMDILFFSCGGPPPISAR